MSILRRSTPNNDLIADVRAVLLESRPFYSDALFQVRFVPAPGLGTMVADKHWRLYFDPDLGETFDTATLAKMVEHLIQHLVRKDYETFADVPEYHAIIANYAGCAAINETITGSETWGVTVQDLDLVGGRTAREYYEELADRGEYETPGDDLGGCGSCAGGSRMDMESWADSFASMKANGEWFDDLDEDTADAVSDAVAEAIQIEASRSRGVMPVGLTAWAERRLSPPIIDWKRQLASYVKAAYAADAKANQEPSYAKRSRRQRPGIILPGVRKFGKRSAGIVIDTSGSVGSAELKRAFSDQRPKPC